MAAAVNRRQQKLIPLRIFGSPRPWRIAVGLMRRGLRFGPD